MKTTVIAHILNEEILLPSWLNHHKKLFKHGVILDCGSTDRSFDIIKQYCPTWEIIHLKQNELGPTRTDIYKVQEIESRISGWKCVLNVSEYLIIDNLEKYLIDFENNNPSKVGFRMTGVIIVDDTNQAHNILQYKDENIITKKNFGYLEKGLSWDGQFLGLGNYPITNNIYRSRLMHKNTTGNYTAGRHNTTLNVDIMDDIYIAWIGRGSPLLYSKRCNSWKAPPSGILIFAGDYYSKMSNFTLAYDFWKSEVKKSYNIFDNIKNYKKYIERLYPN